MTYNDHGDEIEEISTDEQRDYNIDDAGRQINSPHQVEPLRGPLPTMTMMRVVTGSRKLSKPAAGLTRLFPFPPSSSAHSATRPDRRTPVRQGPTGTMLCYKALFREVGDLTAVPHRRGRRKDPR
jgi:hypothetical protein